jgi:hypothetical protein
MRAPVRAIIAGSTVMLAAAATVAVQIAGAAPASAVPGLELVIGVSTYDSADSKSAVVACPPGKLVIGGGGHVIDGDGNVALRELTPGFLVFEAAAAETVAYGGAWEVWAYGICVPPLPGLDIYSYRSAQVTKSDVTELSATATCPAGSKVIGAGGEVSAGSIQWIRPSDQGGVARVEVRGVAEVATSMTVTAIAVCADPLPGYEIVFTPTSPYTGRLLQVSTTCPTDKEVLATGVTKANAPGTSHLDGLFVTPDLTTVWANSRQPNASFPVNLAAWAICAF